jgi:hypothetical protein
VRGHDETTSGCGCLVMSGCDRRVLSSPAVILLQCRCLGDGVAPAGSVARGSSGGSSTHAKPSGRARSAVLPDGVE